MDQLNGTAIKIGSTGYLSTFMHPRLASALKAMALLIVMIGGAESEDWYYSQLNSYSWITYLEQMTIPVLLLIIIDSVLIGIKGRVQVSTDSFSIEREGKPEEVIPFNELESFDLRRLHGKLHSLSLGNTKVEVVLTRNGRESLLQLMEKNQVPKKHVNALQRFMDYIR